MENCVQHLSITIHENDINSGALKILQVIRPTWKPEKITFKLLTDGITNKLVGCKPNDADDSSTVLVRVYGNKTDLLIDRKAETKNIILLNRVGLAPNLYATFDNGLAYKFVPGCTLSAETVILPHIYQLVAKKMAQLHKVVVPNEIRETCLWNKLEKFLNLVPDVFSDEIKHQKYVEIVTPKERIKEELILLKNVLLKLDSPIVFAHNDLLLGNVIYTENENSVTFIDYEYAGYNYQAYDIGNHFAEFTGIEQIDYTKYPEKDFQFRWLRTYLEEFNGKSPSESEIEHLYVQVNQFALTAHIFWGIWALIQAENSYIDFDFIEYAAVRLNEYFARKEQFLSLKLQS